MAKLINMTVVAAICAFGSMASAESTQTQQPTPSFVNDMPFPAEMPVYKSRVVFDDMPFMELPAFVQTAAVFGDMPFPAEMQEYKPVRYFSDLPARAHDLPQETDHAALELQ